MSASTASCPSRSAPAVLIAATIPMYLVREPPCTSTIRKAALSALAFAPKAPILLIGGRSLRDHRCRQSRLPAGLWRQERDGPRNRGPGAHRLHRRQHGVPTADRLDRRPLSQAQGDGGMRHRDGARQRAHPVAASARILLWPVLLVCGAASAGIYTVALSELGERFSGNELVAGTASFATVWGLGAIFGALLGGWAFQTLRAGRSASVDCRDLRAVHPRTVIWRQRMRRS